MKKIVEDLEPVNLVEPTHSDWAAPSLLVPKKDEIYRLIAGYRVLNKQKGKTWWPLQQKMRSLIHLRDKCTSQT